MLEIDPTIVYHEIKTYPNSNLVRQKIRLVNPWKVGFIYLVPLTKWVFNPRPIDNKQGMIRVCMDFQDLNKACPEDNYLTPFIDQIIDKCVRRDFFLFMDGFSGYNQIQIKPKHQHKTIFIFLWGTFSYHKIPLGLKNVGSMFQWAMSYEFHEINHIVEAYLDDLVALSRRKLDCLAHLCVCLIDVITT
jgi:hypothetical protein